MSVLDLESGKSPDLEGKTTPTRAGPSWLNRNLNQKNLVGLAGLGLAAIPHPRHEFAPSLPLLKGKDVWRHVPLVPPMR